MSSSSNIASASGKSRSNIASESGVSSNSRAKRSSDTISKVSNNETGYEVTYSKLRSILIHPIGILLTSFLNGLPPPLMPKNFFKNLLDHHDIDYRESEKQHDSEKNDYSYVLAAAVRRWEGKKEKQLTDTIYSYLDALSSNGRLQGYGCTTNVNSVRFDKEKDANNAPQDGRLDFMITKESSNNITTGNAASAAATAKRSVVAVVEVGKDHDNWWSKTDQILRYVKSIRSSVRSTGNTTEENTNRFIFDQPILLTVMTVTKETGTSNAKIPKTTTVITVPKGNSITTTKEKDRHKKSEQNKVLFDFDEQKNQITDVGFGNDRIRVRLAVFLCTPRDSIDYRIALLWRQDTESLKDASVHFGKILFAATLCAKSREALAQIENCKYRYLGPNCCQIGDSVRFI
jgi:hypothetical protein